MLGLGFEVYSSGLVKAGSYRFKLSRITISLKPIERVVPQNQKKISTYSIFYLLQGLGALGFLREPAPP